MTHTVACLPWIYVVHCYKRIEFAKCIWNWFDCESESGFDNQTRPLLVGCQVLVLWNVLCSQVNTRQSRAHSHRRAPVHMQCVWQDVQAQCRAVAARRSDTPRYAAPPSTHPAHHGRNIDRVSACWLLHVPGLMLFALVYCRVAASFKH